MKGIPGPLPLLTDPNLPFSAKLTWLLARKDALAPKVDQTPGPKRQAGRAGLSYRTLLRAKAELKATGWFNDRLEPRNLTPQAPQVFFPPELLEDGRISPQARILYGFLGADKAMTHTALAEQARVNRLTARRSLTALTQAGWITLARAHHQAPLKITRTVTPSDLQAVELKKVKRRIRFAPYKGEQIMREWLNALIDSDQYDDDAAPGFLVNPWTDGRLELDRFYPPNVAFEFQGPQHDGPTARFTAEEAQRQRGRDMVKIGLCVTQEITLILVYPKDLSRQGMERKVGTVLPRRDLTHLGGILTYLEWRSEIYREEAAAKI